MRNVAILDTRANVDHSLKRMRTPLGMTLPMTQTELEFMWYLKRGVILTKDNLARWNWNGNKQCCFCFSDETIQHLFIDCHVAKFLWRTIQFAFDLNPPHSITHLFGNWIRGVGTKLKRQLLVAASALYCAIWLSRSDVVFDKSPTKTYLQA